MQGSFGSWSYGAFIFLLGLQINLVAQPHGSIHGRVMDTDTKTPLIGVNVVVKGTVSGAASDLDGKFYINHLPVGNYVLQFDYIGYESQRKPDIIVRSERITFVTAELKMAVMELQSVSVTSGYFPEITEQPISTTNFSFEEIRRAPGSGGDISRIIMGLPSLAKVDDQRNGLIVRGGNPIENAFYVDNIEIPNINHFPTQGASGGPLSLINVDFIQDVNFYAGGFPVSFGDRLASVMNITFREGNRQEFDAQFDLNFAGFGGVAEGPLFQKKGSWLVSARRSYLDYLIQAIEVGSSVAPRYGDYQGKLVVDLNPNHQLTWLAILGDDHSHSDQAIARENDMVQFGNQDIYEQTYGVNWRAIWNQSGYSNTSLAVNATRFKEDYFEAGSGSLVFKNRSTEQAVKLRQLNHFRLHARHTLEFGFEVKQWRHTYANVYAEYSDLLGNTTPAFTLDDQIRTEQGGAFLNYQVTLWPQLVTTLGWRADYFRYQQRLYYAPRLAFTYQLSARTSLHGTTGLYYQNLPLVLLLQNDTHRNLEALTAVHYILGWQHRLTENTKLTLEVYQKNYTHFPMDPAQPGLFIIDDAYYQEGFFFNHPHLTDNGRAVSRGIEIMLQKKLAEKLYGLVSGAYFTTRYQGLDGSWRNRAFDNRLILSAEGGYKPNSKWEFSGRWIYAGGRPYAPFNLAASEKLNRAVLDEQQINATRFPAYHSLNLRFDRRFHFNHSNLIAYLSIWNAYNRKNIAQQYWNQFKRQPDRIYQWGLLPIFGLEYEF